MNRDGIRQAADAARLDVHKAAAFQADCQLGLADVVNALVETDRRADLALQFRMIDDVVVVERLLVHREVELVRLLEEFQVSDAIAAVAIDVDRVRRMLFPHGGEHRQIPTGSEFQFDTRETVRDRLADSIKQFV